MKAKCKDLNTSFHMTEIMTPRETEQDYMFESTSERVCRLPCRICLSEIHSPENPLISPCDCKGTMKYIHLECLRSFMRSKLSTRTTQTSVSIA